LGSGVRNLFKYCKVYSNSEPEIIEGDIFKINIALPVAGSSDQATDQATDQVTDQVDEQLNLILEFCSNPRSIKEIMEHFGYTNRSYFRNTFLAPLLSKNKLILTIPEKPNSPKQKYIVNKQKVKLL
jgi:ATP-dependent DNA helicase RecG